MSRIPSTTRETPLIVAIVHSRFRPVAFKVQTMFFLIGDFAQLSKRRLVFGQDFTAVPGIALALRLSSLVVR